MTPVSVVKMVEVGSQINIVQMLAFVSSTNIYVSPVCLELDMILTRGAVLTIRYLFEYHGGSG